MTFKEQTQQIVERGKELAEEGKQRQITLNNRDGQELVSTNLTIVVAVSLFLLVTGFLSAPLVIIAAAFGYWRGWRLDYSGNQVAEV